MIDEITLINIINHQILNTDPFSSCTLPVKTRDRVIISYKSPGCQDGARRVDRVSAINHVIDWYF